MSLGNRIKRLRKDKNLTQKQLADKLQTDAAYISRIEGDKQNPSIPALERMTEILECDLSDFFKDKVNAPELEGKVRWVKFIEEMEDKNITPDELANILETFEILTRGRGK